MYDEELKLVYGVPFRKNIGIRAYMDQSEKRPSMADFPD